MFEIEYLIQNKLSSIQNNINLYTNTYHEISIIKEETTDLKFLFKKFFTSLQIEIDYKEIQSICEQVKVCKEETYDILKIKSTLQLGLQCNIAGINEKQGNFMNFGFLPKSTRVSEEKRTFNTIDHSSK